MDIIKELRQKNKSGLFDTYLIGTDSKLVSPIRGTSVNNIEEQLLIGIDCITTTSVYNEHRKTIKEFKNDSIIDDKYYTLTTYDFITTNAAKTFMPIECKIELPSDIKENVPFYSDGLVLGNDNTIISTINLNTKFDNPVVKYSCLNYDGTIVSQMLSYYIEQDNGIVKKDIIKNILEEE